MNGTSRKRLPRQLNRLAESPWIAYGTILVLQLKVMLWVWKYRDLATGDTSSYYSDVFTWLDGARVNFVWSPVYTGFLAVLHSVLGDPFRVLVVARLLVAVGASLLILALLRRLLPKPMAWIVAAWWALLPINFDTVYSVHLFSALFPIGLFVIAAYVDNIYGRGIVLGGLLLTALLVRNEYSALFVLTASATFGYELYLYFRKDPRAHSFQTNLAAYGLPLVGAALIIGLFYANSDLDYAGIKKELEAKHTVNICQIYAYNRLQQGDPWRGSPWTDCHELLERDFGKSAVTFSQAFFLNPRAVLQHIWWNFKLIPSGTQLALFNYYAGGPNPDYINAKQSFLVWGPFLLAVVLAVFAASTHLVLPALRKRQPLENGFCWFVMSGAAFLVVGLMLMQRPRPSYMFPYTLFIMALTGLGLHRLLEVLRVNGVVRQCWPLAALGLILFAPSHYDVNYVNSFGYKGQGYRNAYERIAPHVNRATASSSPVIVTPMGDDNLCNYLGVAGCSEIPYGQVAGPNFESRAAALGVTWVYLDAAFGPVQLQFDPGNWQIVSQGQAPAEPWVLMRRQGGH